MNVKFGSLPLRSLCLIDQLNKRGELNLWFIRVSYISIVFFFVKNYLVLLSGLILLKDQGEFLREKKNKQKSCMKKNDSNYFLLNLSDWRFLFLPFCS